MSWPAHHVKVISRQLAHPKDHHSIGLHRGPEVRVTKCCLCGDHVVLMVLACEIQRVCIVGHWGADVAGLLPGVSERVPRATGSRREPLRTWR
jgi:hypothetical protein